MGRQGAHERRSAVLRLVIVAAPCLAVAGLAFGGFAPASGAGTVPAATGAPARTTARDRYLSDCAVCHGAKGQGTVRGPDLRGVGRASIDYQLSTGRMPLAPAVRMDDQGRPLVADPNRTLPSPSATPDRHDPAYPPLEVRDLVDYVASLGKGGLDIPKVEPGDRAEGGQLFRLNCAACHAAAGDGGALSHREAPSVKPATPVQIGEAVRVGPGQMPAFGEAALDQHQLDDLVSYVRYLDHPDDRGGRPLGHIGPVAEGAVALVAIALVMFGLRAIGERG